MSGGRGWVPPRIVRRLVVAPVLIAATVFLFVSLPLWVLATAFASRYIPGRWRPLRVAWFLFVYLWWELVVLAVAFAYWIASGFGRRIHTPAWQTRHYALAAWWLDRVMQSARKTFHVTIEREGDVASKAHPVLVFSRHAGPGDSFLLVDAVLNGSGLRPRIVFKDLLQYDPCVDVLLNRVPSRFVPSRGRAGDAVVTAIGELAAGMEEGDALVLFPEGGNYTPRRHARAIEKLAEIGREDLSERAQAMQNVLPPKPTGALTAIEAAPCADVAFVGHVGLDELSTLGDLWRGIPLDASVRARVWLVEAVDVPPPDERETWLYDHWQVLDDWISEQNAARDQVV